jgi:transcriptional antiterminator
MIVNGHTQFKLKDTEDMFKVGERTIRYDMEYVSGWLKTYGVHLDHASGQGVWELEEMPDAGKRKELDEAMNLYGRADAAGERFLLITYELLMQDHSQSLRQLAEEVDVSRGTVLQEMEKVESWSGDFNLTLERGRKGFVLTGQERDKRLALLSVISQLESAWNSMNPVPYLNWSEISMKEMETAGKRAEEELPPDGSPTAFLKVWMLHMQRVRSGKKLSAGDRQIDIEEWFQTVWDRFCTEFNMEVEEGEMEFGYCYLRATSNLYSDSVPDYAADNAFTTFIEEISTRMGLTGFNTQQLQHIFKEWRAYLYAGDCGIQFVHPLKQKVEEQYPFIVFHVKEALASHTPEGTIRNTDSMIPIAMSFATIYEKASFDNERYQIWVMCPGGIAAGRLLTVSLMKHFPQLEVKQTAAVSMLHKTEGWEKPDFIVSTVTLPDSPYPYVTINPIITDNEIKKMEHFIKDLKQKNGSTKITETPDSIHALIPPSRICVRDAADLDEILQTGVELLEQDRIVEQQFLEDIRRTVIEKNYLYEIVPGLSFVHTHSGHVNRAGFSLVQLKQPYVEEGRLHSYAVLFMATPDKYAHLPQLQYLYQLLTNADRVQQILHWEENN